MLCEFMAVVYLTKTALEMPLVKKLVDGVSKAIEAGAAEIAADAKKTGAPTEPATE